jgi:hypothetical protein
MIEHCDDFAANELETSNGLKKTINANVGLLTIPIKSSLSLNISNTLNKEISKGGLNKPGVVEKHQFQT